MPGFIAAATAAAAAAAAEFDDGGYSPGGVEGTDSEIDLREMLSRCVEEGRDVLRLIPRNASVSPLLKEPAPCLNSHWAVSEEWPFELLGP